MTPAELQALVEADFEREKIAWIREAWFASLLLAPHCKRGRQPEPEKLLPKCFREKRQPKTAADRTRELEDLKKELKVE